MNALCMHLPAHALLVLRLGFCTLLEMREFHLTQIGGSTI